jgi:magnesium-transporting ATPase (P-type)
MDVHQRGKCVCIQADNVISERILPTTFNIDTSIAELSKKGLRTLMVGMKIISHEELEQFKTVLSKSELNNRDVILEEYS